MDSFSVHVLWSWRAAMVLLLCLVSVTIVQDGHAQTNRTFYVDAENGSDDNDGLSRQTPFRRAFIAFDRDLLPGDRVLFRRGQVHAGPESFVTRDGTAEQPIYIGAYGQGNDPVLMNNIGTTFDTVLWVIGDYITITDLDFAFTAEYGVHISGNHVTVENNEFYEIGIAIGVRGDNATIRNNIIRDLNMVRSDSQPGNDYGAMGVLVNEGRNALITENVFENILQPSIDYGVDGAPLEIFPDTSQGIRNLTFSRNRIHTCDNLVEVGSGQRLVARNIRLNHNIIENCNAAVVVHAINSGTGFETDVQQFYFDNNTVINSDIVWISDTSLIDTAYVRNNLFVYDNAPDATHSGRYRHINNIYYAPDLQFEYQLGMDLHPSEQIINPNLNENYTVPQNSPAVDGGSFEVDYPNVDYFGLIFPRGAAPDVGAVETAACTEAGQTGPDINEDGLVTPPEVSYIVSRIGSNDLTADADCDGDVDVVDADYALQSIR